MQSCGFVESVLRKVKRGGHHAPYLHPDPDLAKANSPRGVITLLPHTPTLVWPKQLIQIK